MCDERNVVSIERERVCGRESYCGRERLRKCVIEIIIVWTEGERVYVIEDYCVCVCVWRERGDKKMNSVLNTE